MRSCWSGSCWVPSSSESAPARERRAQMTIHFKIPDSSVRYFADRRRHLGDSIEHNRSQRSPDDRRIFRRDSARNLSAGCDFQTCRTKGRSHGCVGGAGIAAVGAVRTPKGMGRRMAVAGVDRQFNNICCWRNHCLLCASTRAGSDHREAGTMTHQAKNGLPSLARFLRNRVPATAAKR